MQSLENSASNRIELPNLVSTKCLFIDIGNTKLNPNDNSSEITSNLLHAEKSTFKSLGLSLVPKSYSLSDQSPLQ